MRSIFKLYAIVISMAVGIACGGMLTGCSSQPTESSSNESSEIDSSATERFSGHPKELVTALAHAVPQVAEDGTVQDTSLSLVVGTTEIPKLTELTKLEDKLDKFKQYCVVFNTEDIAKFFVGVLEVNLDVTGSDEMELANLETSIGEALTASNNPYMIRRIGKYILLQIGETGDVDSAAFASQISQLAGIEANKEVASGMTGQQEVPGGLDGSDEQGSSGDTSSEVSNPEVVETGNSQGGENSAQSSSTVANSNGDVAATDNSGDEWVLSDGTAATDVGEGNSEVNPALLKDDSVKAAAKAKAATDSVGDTAGGSGTTVEGNEAVGGPAADVGLDMSGLDDVIHRADDPAFGNQGDGKPKNAD